MKSVTVPNATAAPGARSLVRFTAILLGLTALVLFLSDGGVLFSAPLWVDEWLTVFVARRSSPAQIFGDLAAGADGGAPLLHLTLWAVRGIVGTLDPIVIRALSLASVLLALVFVFLVLRRRVAQVAATAGALAIGAHSLVVAHSYDGRYYGPWLLCAALVAWMLGRRQDAPRGPVGLALSSFALCLVHPYGILSLALLVAGALASYGSDWRRGTRDVAPAAAGVLALAIVIPLALGQRAAYSVPTWLPDFRLRQLRNLVLQFWGVSVPVAAVVVLLVAGGIRMSRQRVGITALVAPLRDAGALALLGLAFIPFVLGLISAVGQPSMLSRYALVTVLAWAPVVALACQHAGVWPTRVACLALAWFWFAAYVHETRNKTLFAMGVSEADQAYSRALRTGLPVVVQSMHVMYPLIGSAPRQSPAIFLSLSDSTVHALFPDSTRLGQANRGVVLERDLARVHHDRWGFPRLMTAEALDTVGRFLLLAPEGRRPLGYASMAEYARKLFPDHQITRLTPELSLLDRAGPKASSK